MISFGNDMKDRVRKTQIKPLFYSFKHIQYMLLSYVSFLFIVMFLNKDGQICFLSCQELILINR